MGHSCAHSRKSYKNLVRLYLKGLFLILFPFSISYFILPGMIPTNVGAFTHLLGQIQKRVADGYRVLVHCFGGLGRAVLVGACLMLMLDQVTCPYRFFAQNIKIEVSTR